MIDCPPQLGYLTMGALNAATAMLVTIHPQMVDVASMSQFLLMTSDLMTVIEEAGGRLQHDFIRYVVTRHDPNDVPEAQIVALLRNLFGDDVLRAMAWRSTAIANAGLTKQSLYGLDRGSVGRAAYDRALPILSMAVNAEIAELPQGGVGTMSKRTDTIRTLFAEPRSEMWLSADNTSRCVASRVVRLRSIT